MINENYFSLKFFNSGSNETTMKDVATTDTLDTGRKETKTTTFKIPTLLTQADVTDSLATSKFSRYSNTVRYVFISTTYSTDSTY